MRVTIIVAINLAITTAFSTALAFPDPVTINFYPVSPVAGHIYPSNKTLPIAFGIDNAIAAFQFGFILNMNISGVSFEYSDSTPELMYVNLLSVFSGNNSQTSTPYIFNDVTKTTFSKGYYTFGWSLIIYNCSETPVASGTQIDIWSGPVGSAMIEFFVNDDGTAVPVGQTEGTGNGDIQVVYTENSASCAGIVTKSFLSATGLISTPVFSTPTTSILQTTSPAFTSAFPVATLSSTSSTPKVSLQSNLTKSGSNAMSSNGSVGVYIFTIVSVGALLYIFI